MSYELDAQPLSQPLPSSGERGQKGKRYQKAIWISLITAAVLTAGLLVYILFFRTSPAPAPTFLGDAQLTITAPPQSPSGSEISYELVIKNSSNAKLTALTLEIFYPQGFEFIDSTPDSKESSARTFSFSDLLPQKEHQLVIVGRLAGSLQEVKSLSAKLHYIPENFRSSFVTEASAATVVLAPDLSLRLLAPAHVVTSQTMTYEIKVQNLTSHPFTDLLLRLTLPEKFETLAKKELAIASLGIGEAKAFLISGKILEEAGAESFAEIELLQKSSEGEPLLVVGRAFAFTQIRPSPLVLSHELLNPLESIVMGQKLRYAVTYENRGDVGLRNVGIAVVFSAEGGSPAGRESEVFDFSQIETQTGQLVNKSLRFLPALNPELLIVPPKASGKFEFSILISKNLASRLQKNPVASSRVEFSAQEITEPLTGNSLEYKIQSQVEVRAEASKLDGQYEIKLLVSNTVNDLTEAELLATIPSGSAVFLTDTIEPLEERAQVSFTPGSGLLKWRLERIFAFTGSFHDARELSFRMTAGAEALLLRDIQVTARDEFTGAKALSNKIESLTAQ